MVHKDASGKLIDITPHKGNPNEILFLEDTSIKYEGFQINNIRKNISRLSLIDVFIENHNKLFDIFNEGDLRYKHGLVTLSKENAIKRSKILKENDIIMMEVLSKIKTRPNEPCHCGSGKKYKKCCIVR